MSKQRGLARIEVMELPEEGRAREIKCIGEKERSGGGVEMEAGQPEPFLLLLLLLLLLLRCKGPISGGEKDRERANRTEPTGRGEHADSPTNISFLKKIH